MLIVLTDDHVETRLLSLLNSDLSGLSFFVLSENQRSLIFLDLQFPGLLQQIYKFSALCEEILVSLLLLILFLSQVAFDFLDLLTTLILEPLHDSGNLVQIFFQVRNVPLDRFLLFFAADERVTQRILWNFRQKLVPSQLDLSLEEIKVVSQQLARGGPTDLNRKLHLGKLSSRHGHPLVDAEDQAFDLSLLLLVFLKSQASEGDLHLVVQIVHDRLLRSEANRMVLCHCDLSAIRFGIDHHLFWVHDRDFVGGICLGQVVVYHKKIS